MFDILVALDYTGPLLFGFIA